MSDDSTVPETETSYPQVRFEAPPGATEILLVRHGESAPARPGVPFELKDGHGDPALAPNGREQAEAVGRRLADEPVDAIYVTSLRRTHETAAPLAARKGMATLEEPDLREIFLGDWEGGVLRIRAAAEDPIYLEMHEREDWGVIPGAESFAELTTRCVAAIQRIHAAHIDEKVVVVVHGGVIGALCAYVTGSRNFAFAGADNGSIHHLVVHGDDWRLRRYNDTAHLGGFTTAAGAMT